ncbi:RagB/SusD family nutrient uptake outer membrane protein [Sinomicrobium pectinilyticum]|uniref:RagB/SusD family nutrient uptake outer membrane protein n=1 Tax=Sinomicrobium pectinilyticum TaxID=1084421 RepID=A0A3N0EAT9_SINP1|nr:RagB/SusD family nutrient uptake outer membrane protein [Sinomicrobium pectinilyticum]RNL84930.1 RagB/SusD family nutrient uptake outer membrane protein [Sinomicrobium pectinilyticum]
MEIVKKYKNYTVVLFYTVITVLVAAGCNTDDLELSDPNGANPETFLESETQVISAVNAIYANLQTQGLWGRHMFFMMDNLSHENSGNPQLEADKQQYLAFSFDASHGAIRAYWESCFRGINKANYIISNEQKIQDILGMSQEAKNKSIGEARFLRAYYYFLLVTRYGDVPMITDVIVEDQEGFPRTSLDQIYDEVIIPDLEYAAANLYSNFSERHEWGRATYESAYALLGKVHLYREDYGLARDAFSEIINDFSLSENFADNFLEETEHNEESIFEIEYDESLGAGNLWDSDVTGAGQNEATLRGQEYGWNDWFNVYPSDDLLEEYEDGDPRYTASFYFNGDSFNNGEGVVNIPLERKAAWKKYQNYYKRANENINSSINFRVIRYADVLLMMAEAENALGNSDAAIDYLNQVRDRVDMPNYGTPEMDALYPVSTPGEVFAAIVHERKVELAGEQVRFPDLVRWGMGGQIPNFVVGKNEVFPIPLAEIAANNSISQADQNNGY